MPWQREYETTCDAYELDLDTYTNKKKWSKRGLNANLTIYSNVDDMNDLKVCFELHTIQVWWQIFDKKLKKKGSKTRVVTFKRFGEEIKEVIALRFADSQICQSFIAKWEALTRDWDDYISSGDSDEKQGDPSEEEPNGQSNRQSNGHSTSSRKSKKSNNSKSKLGLTAIDEEKEMESFKKVADKSSFRDLIKLNHCPDISLVESSSVLKEYYFDYGVHKVLHQKYEDMDFAQFSYGKYHNEEHYVSLWMNPEIITAMPFQRPRTNIVVVIDKSESMNESLSTNSASRMECVHEALIQLCRHTLDKSDRFAIVSFNEQPQVEWPLQLVDDLPYGMLDLRKKILSIRPQGTTDLKKAFVEALKQFEGPFSFGVDSQWSMFRTSEEERRAWQEEGYYNRIVLMTDYPMDASRIDEYNADDGLFGMIKAAARDRQIYTTFMSLGVPIDDNLFHSSFSGAQGCHYMNVGTRDDLVCKFSKDLVEINRNKNQNPISYKGEFKYMVAPILYDLKVGINTKILQAYTRNADIGDIHRGELLTARNLFGNMNYSEPVILKVGFAKELKLTVTYTVYQGQKKMEFKNEQVIDLQYSNDAGKAKLVEQKDFYESIGIRKVVLLCRYVDLLRLWLKTDVAVKQHAQDGKLAVSEEFKEKFAEFADYFKKEMEIIDDAALQRELDILVKLSQYVDTVDID